MAKWKEKWAVNQSKQLKVNIRAQVLLVIFPDRSIELIERTFKTEGLTHIHTHVASARFRRRKPKGWSDGWTVIKD